MGQDYRAVGDLVNSDIPHPREVFDFLPGENARIAFSSALERGRLHHAWLLVGPEGVGKSTFAYHVARRLLGAAPDPAFGPLGSRRDDPVSRQIAARAHPDLLVLQRDPEDGRSRKGIPAEEVRGLSEFFAKSPALAGFRVAIIDTGDDLNLHGANAVLKTLEEPPERGVILLISNAPGGLLATLRSRCRRLKLDPPPVAEVRAWLVAKSGVDEADAEKLIAMARGTPGRAWRLAICEGLEIDRAAQEILRTLPSPDSLALLKLADGFRGATGAARFDLLFERLAAQIRNAATKLATEEGNSAEAKKQWRWAEAWEFLVRLPREAEALNLDRVDAFYTALSRLRSIA
ncbi:MAG TPA: DNA polymerase III subunit delta' [Caulobacteraceae bacterium]